MTEPTEEDLRSMAFTIRGHVCKDAYVEGDSCWSWNDQCGCRIAYESAEAVYAQLRSTLPAPRLTPDDYLAQWEGLTECEEALVSKAYADGLAATEPRQ